MEKRFSTTRAAAEWFARETGVDKVAIFAHLLASRNATMGADDIVVTLPNGIEGFIRDVQPHTRQDFEERLSKIAENSDNLPENWQALPFHPGLSRWSLDYAEKGGWDFQRLLSHLWISRGLKEHLSTTGVDSADLSDKEKLEWLALMLPSYEKESAVYKSWELARGFVKALGAFARMEGAPVVRTAKDFLGVLDCAMWPATAHIYMQKEAQKDFADNLAVILVLQSKFFKLREYVEELLSPLGDAKFSDFDEYPAVVTGRPGEHLAYLPTRYATPGDPLSTWARASLLGCDPTQMKRAGLGDD